MPKIDFNTMPSSARVWVFGAAAPVVGAAHQQLIDAVDAHLHRWAAHGVPLRCARDWRDDRFLAIAVDEAATGASGCSIDGLFRVLTSLEGQLGTSLLDGSTVFWRDANNSIHAASRSAFKAAGVEGRVDGSTTVFDTTVDSVGAWRDQFERAAAASWHAKLIAPASVPR